MRCPYEIDNALSPRRVVIAFLHSPNHSHHHHRRRRHWGFFCAAGWHLAEDLQSGGNNTNYVLLDDAIPLFCRCCRLSIWSSARTLSPSPRFPLSLLAILPFDLRVSFGPDEEGGNGSRESSRRFAILLLGPLSQLLYRTVLRIGVFLVRFATFSRFV